MLHGLCFGEEAGARNLVFFRVKWLQATMKGTSCVRRLRLRSVYRFFLLQCHGGFKLLWVWLCVRSYRVFWNLWLQIPLEWLHDVAWAMFWGGSRSTKPCVFPCKVAAGDDERYLVCATVAAAVGLSFFFCRSVTVASSCFGCEVEDRKSYWNGCIQAATVICEQIFSILALIIFLLKFLLKSASKSSFCRFGVEIRFGAAISDAIARNFPTPLRVQNTHCHGACASAGRVIKA